MGLISDKESTVDIVGASRSRPSLASGPVYFYVTPLGPPDNNGYPHPLVALAEGLRELGVPTYANINHWRESPDSEAFLFTHDADVSPRDCTAVVLDNCWTHAAWPLPEELFKPGRRFRTAFFDFEDSYPSVATREEFRGFDFVFRPHWNSHLEFPDNFRPWAFGPTMRILRETAAGLPFASRARHILVSYRVGHPVRDLAGSRFLKPFQHVLPAYRYSDSFQEPPEGYHHLQWHQTGRRHNTAYYAQLNRAQACACFGGTLIAPAIAPRHTLQGLVQRVQVRMNRLPKFVCQWDSFRLWESWASGAATFHVDLEKYGARLPVMPGNCEHYIGVDLQKPRDMVERLRDDPMLLDRVAASGRQWALEHYHPVEVARRFLATLFG